MSTPSSPSTPVLGFVLAGGPLSGALVRDIRLANELADRGFPVHVWWAIDKQKNSGLRDSIPQHWLFHGARYADLPLFGQFGKPVKEGFGKFLTAMFDDRKRIHVVQKRPDVVRSMACGMIRRVCMGVETDSPTIRRFADSLASAGVTHLLPMLEFLCPFIVAAQARMSSPPKFLMTFQGYELYGNYGRLINLERQLYSEFTKAFEKSSWNAVAVSEDYADRVTEDVGIPRSRLTAIPPGIPTTVSITRERARELVKQRLKNYDPALPLVSFFGRRDTEKGLDLLLYAANMLRRQGLRFQLAICGPTLFGTHYSVVCKQIAEDLRLPVLWSGQVSDELRSSILMCSRCVAYPSIHREPFGMVPVEALAHGTPAIVPDYGGVATVIHGNNRTGGMTFRSWDSGHLAEQIHKLLSEETLWKDLSDAGPVVAEYYSVQHLADRILAHIGLERQLRPH
ncbi:MAG TPA: glycosyltransferase family 4 protein [Phycisphaerales bacterium]|nr:glycosyltransferase family 4 protein [Phycisphaerales bacterium]